ncbi:protein of unknown function (plasmid) [Cupriavidus taiwanensis]|uniref:Uncharacterized protein n=2 Tax=Cupriavidus taiwanensis TaxID=164546 RepID=A0A375HB04_9BURK|nr:protein of unknown function [Cupriavidus taiwanensis]SPD49174.1 protein of unknown function [Cupriavidus taiwanensis]
MVRFIKSWRCGGVLHDLSTRFQNGNFTRTDSPVRAFFCMWSPSLLAETTVGEFYISTVFLGLDHQWADGPPLIFETMVYEQAGVFLAAGRILS